MRKHLLILLFVIAYTFGQAQVDSIFWFAAPEVSTHNQNFDKPIYLRIITYGQAAQVTISQPAGTMPTQTVNIPANSVQTVNLTAWIDIIENKPADNILNYGLQMQSTALVTMYYEVASESCQCNPEIFVLKGQNAMGTDFYIPSQNLLQNNPTYSPQPFSSFDIVATQNNTNVTITPSNAIVGHAATTPFSITLNAGQTYSATAASYLAAQHLQGSRVVADKPIAITVKDDLLNGGPYGTCSDLGGDQIVPISVVGSEYIAMNGFLNAPGDQLFITATQNGTSISQNGSAVTTINAGQTYQLAVGGPSTYVQTSAPAYVWQLSGIGCEVGLDILPPIVCTGGFSVALNRTTNELLYVNLLVRNGGQGSFQVNGSSTVITAGMFSVVPGTSGQWYSAQVSLPAGQFPIGTPIFITNSTSLFHAGMLHGSGGSGTRFGYFSNFAKFEALARATSNDVCIGDSIQLFADTLPLATYSWTGPNSFTSTLQNTFVTNAPLAATGNYIVVANVLGCVSIPDTVYVTVHDIDTTNIAVSICPNTTYTLPDGISATTAGTYVSHLQSQYGCDSVIITNLSIATTAISTSNDTSICQGESVQLNTTGGLIYSWIPVAGLSNPNIANPVATPLNTTTYTVTSQVETGTNAISNGNFSSGNAGFTSSYSYSANNTTEGQYYVGTNASAWNPGMASCGDHTTGSGNMLFVNGATTANVSIYCQSVAVTPNTDYAFSTWLMTLTSGNPAQLQFSINGSLVGSVFTANNSTCIWEQFYTTWNSGNSTSATICIVNQNTIASANDFALDDISFKQICSVFDTVRITVNTPVIHTVDTNICQGNTYTFPLGNTSNIAINDTAILTGPNGCDSTVITRLTVSVLPNTTVNASICNGTSYTLPSGTTVTTAGTYIDTLSTNAGCDSIVTTNLNVLPSSLSTINHSICSGSSYLLPSGTSVNTAGTYTDTLVAANGCDSIITINLSLLANTGSIVNDTICQGDNYTLPNGNTISAAGIYYDTLTATNGCDSIVTTNLYTRPIVNTLLHDTICLGSTYTLPDGTSTNTAGTYTATFQNIYGCDSIVTTHLVAININLSTTVTDVLCNGDANGIISIVATNGATPYTYYLNTGSTNSTGIFSSLSAASYTVTVIDSYGCADTISPTVYEPAILSAANTLNDVSCYGANDGTANITATGGTSPYTYLLNTQSNTTGIFNTLSAANYTFSVTDANACIYTNSLTITEPAELLVVVTPDSATINLGEELQLLATSNYDPATQYLWSPSAGLSCTTCPNPNVVSLVNTSYVLQASVDVNGKICSTSNNVSVIVIPNYDLFIPNAFTPDGNGFNDFFEIFGNQKAIKYIDVKIFNRIGEKVFESNDIYFQWDGKYKGVLQPPGVYTYTINTVFIDNEHMKIYKGGITLLR